MRLIETTVSYLYRKNEFFRSSDSEIKYQEWKTRVKLIYMGPLETSDLRTGLLILFYIILGAFIKLLFPFLAGFIPAFFIFYNIYEAS